MSLGRRFIRIQDMDDGFNKAESHPNLLSLLVTDNIIFEGSKEDNLLGQSLCSLEVCQQRWRR